MAEAPRSWVSVRALWGHRRWAFGAYMLLAVLRLPARVGFRLHAPICDTHLTAGNVALSMTKVPHMVLFGAFALLTVFQFDRIDRRAWRWSLLATVALGVVVELEEGATRTGNCRLTDVLPDVTAAAIAVTALVGLAIVGRWWVAARTPHNPRPPAA